MRITETPVSVEITSAANSQVEKIMGGITKRSGSKSLSDPLMISRFEELRVCKPMHDTRHILGTLSGMWTTTRLQWQLRCSGDIVSWFGGWFVVGFRPTAVVRDPRSPLLFPPDTLSVPIGHADHPAAPWASPNASAVSRTASSRGT